MIQNLILKMGITNPDTNKSVSVETPIDLFDHMESIHSVDRADMLSMIFSKVMELYEQKKTQKSHKKVESRTETKDSFFIWKYSKISYITHSTIKGFNNDYRNR